MDAKQGEQQSAGPGPPWRWVPLRRVLAKRCPQCGKGALFQSFARLHESCAECGLRYRREAGSMTGSMYVSAAVTEVFAAAVALALFWFTDLPMLWGCVLAVLLVAGFSYAFLPRSMALWVAVEYCTDRANNEPWIEPR